MAFAFARIALCHGVTYGTIPVEVVTHRMLLPDWLRLSERVYVVAGFTAGQVLTLLGVATTITIAFGFLALTLLGGRAGRAVGDPCGESSGFPGTTTMLAVMVAFGLAWLAATVGSAMIIGAFAAGLLLRETP